MREKIPVQPFYYEGHLIEFRLGEIPPGGRSLFEGLLDGMPRVLFLSTDREEEIAIEEALVKGDTRVQTAIGFALTHSAVDTRADGIWVVGWEFQRRAPYVKYVIRG